MVRNRVLRVVLGELLFKTKSIDSDFNDAVDNGIYTSSSLALNRPSEEQMNYNVKVTVYLDTIIQEAYSRTSTIHKYIRIYRNNAWNYWQEM